MWRSKSRARWCLTVSVASSSYVWQSPWSLRLGCSEETLYEEYCIHTDLSLSWLRPGRWAKPAIMIGNSAPGGALNQSINLISFTSHPIHIHYTVLLLLYDHIIWYKLNLSWSNTSKKNRYCRFHRSRFIHHLHVHSSHQNIISNHLLSPFKCSKQPTNRTVQWLVLVSFRLLALFDSSHCRPPVNQIKYHPIRPPVNELD